LVVISFKAEMEGEIMRETVLIFIFAIGAILVQGCSTFGQSRLGPCPYRSAPSHEAGRLAEDKGMFQVVLLRYSHKDGGNKR